MSHRAVVAYPAGSGSPHDVDLHLSRNGANHLKLLPVLRAAVEDGRPRDPIGMEEIPDDVTAILDDIEGGLGRDGSDRKLVEPTPLQRDVPRRELGRTVDYVLHEAVLEVTPDGREAGGGAVDVHLPAFVDVGVVMLFVSHIDLEVHPRAELPDAPHEAVRRVQETDVEPSVSLSGMDYLDLRDGGEAFEHFVDAHLGILQTLYSLAPQSDEGTVRSALVTERSVVLATVRDADGGVPLPDPHGAGLLISLPVDDLPHDALASLYDDWRHLANRLRVEHSLAATEAVVEAAEGGADPSAVNDNLSGLLDALLDEFEPNVSPHTPSEVLDQRTDRG